MIALRSPGVILNVTAHTAWRPPKLFDSPFHSRTGVYPSHFGIRPRPVPVLLAVLAGWIVAAIDRRRQELGLLELAELAHVRIGLDDRVPQLGIRIAKHLLLLDLLDVDVLHRIAHVVEADRPTQRIELHRRQLLDELLGAGELAVAPLDDLIDHV